jgi:AcrR family transcriptional regulator
VRVRTEAKRESILEIAGQVFQEMGYERASMAEIAARVGGSKATLYGYFPSKQDLFLEVAGCAAARHMSKPLAELIRSRGDLPLVLRRFGEEFLSFLCTPQATATYRMVIAESGQSDIGRRFYESGPKRGEAAIATFLQSQMDAGRLKKADASVATMHLVALLEAETVDRRLMGVGSTPTRHQIKQFVDRAVKVFLAAYAA